MIAEIGEISGDVAKVKLIKDELDAIKDMQEYIPEQHKENLDVNIKKAENDINKYCKRFFLEKDDNNIVGTKDYYWFELNKALKWLRNMRTYNIIVYFVRHSQKVFNRVEVLARTPLEQANVNVIRQ